MTDNSPDALANKLHSIQRKRGMTVQSMAEACGIPKSSLESYMKTVGAKQPGLKALIAIADGLDVSLDWLAGRIPENVSTRLTANDHAMRHYSGILHALEVHGRPELTTEEKHQFAAREMLEFISGLQLAEANHETDGDFRKEVSDRFVGGFKSMKTAEE